MTTIQEYYKLKENQEKKMKSIKNTIFSLTPSHKERRTLLKKKYIKCPNCKKIGGLRFYSDYDTLYTECNATDNCDYKIEITKSHSKPISELYLPQRINNIKEILIELKTKNLFRFMKDDETIKQLEEVITELEEKTKLYNTLEENKKDTGELNKLEMILLEIINGLKDKTPFESIEIYNTVLKNTLDEIRKIKYESIHKYIASSDNGNPESIVSQMQRVIFLKDNVTDYTIDMIKS